MKLFVTRIFQSQSLDLSIPFPLLMLRYLNISKLSLKHYTVFKVQFWKLDVDLLLPVWWAQMDSNHRPRAYQARALTA